MKKKELIVLVVITFIGSFIISFLFSHIEKQREINSRKEYLEEQSKIETMKEADNIPPVLILKQNKLTIYQGDKINYKAFIKEANDNLDGNIINSVTYNKIDTNELGNYIIEYKLSDSAGNISTSNLEINVIPSVIFAGMD